MQSRERWRATIQFVLMASLMLLAREAAASSGTTIDGAVTGLTAMFILGAYLLGFAGTAGLVYSIAQRTFGLTLDGSIALLLACAVTASWPTMGGWVGVSAAATLP